MIILINGEKREVSAKNVKQLVEDLQLNPGLIVIEVNKEIVAKETWGNVELKEGMAMEIVHFVGGG